MRRAVRDWLIAFNPVEAVRRRPALGAARLHTDRAAGADAPPRSRGRPPGGPCTSWRSRGPSRERAPRPALARRGPRGRDAHRQERPGAGHRRGPTGLRSEDRIPRPPPSRSRPQRSPRCARTVRDSSSSVSRFVTRGRTAATSSPRRSGRRSAPRISSAAASIPSAHAQASPHGRVCGSMTSGIRADRSSSPRV
jgi:hypothetical protein